MPSPTTPTMPNFTEFKNALSAQIGDNAVFALGENQRTTVASYIVSNTILPLLGTKLTLSSVSEANATFIKNLGQTFHEKTAVGPGSFEVALYDKVTFNWNKPLYQTIGYTQADIELGVPAAFTTKLEKAAADYTNYFERKGFEKIENSLTADNKVETTNLLDINLSATDAYDKVVNLGNELTKLQNKKDGIDGIKNEDIIILVSPEVLQKIAKTGMIGNNASQIFEGGRYAITSLGGYKVIAVPFLTKTQALATTNFAVASMVKVNAANSDRLVPTNDTGLYFEAMSIIGVVYPSCFKCISKD